MPQLTRAALCYLADMQLRLGLAAVGRAIVKVEPPVLHRAFQEWHVGRPVHQQRYATERHQAEKLMEFVNASFPLRRKTAKIHQDSIAFEREPAQRQLPRVVVA